MGIDLLDVSFRIEREIRVSLTSDDWHQLAEHQQDFTAGQLYHLILDRLEIRNVLLSDLGVNEMFWREMQRCISRVRGLPLSSVQLSTPLGDVFPLPSVADDLQTVERDSGYRIPFLHRPRSPIVESTVFVLGIVPAILAATQQEYLIAVAIFLATMTLTIVALLLSRSLHRRQWLNQIRSMISVKSLCRYIRDQNPEKFELAQSPADEGAHVWTRLRNVIVDSLGVDDEEVVPEAWFVKDLGLE